MNDETLLHRQVNPTWIKFGMVTSQLFKPTTKDKKFVSVYDGDQITAKDSHIHYTKILLLPSVGVMAVTIEDCVNFQLEVQLNPAPFPEHVEIDFSKFTNSQIDSRAKKLRAAAVSRGWQYSI